MIMSTSSKVDLGSECLCPELVAIRGRVGCTLSPGTESGWSKYPDTISPKQIFQSKKLRNTFFIIGNQHLLLYLL